MRYTNKIDNSVFASKEEAMKFFEQSYLVEFTEQESEESEIISKIQTILPDCDISIHVENSNWGKYKVIVRKENVEIDQWLYAIDDDNYSTAIKTLEALVEFFKWSFEKTLYIMNQVKQKYDFKEFKFERYHDDYGNGHFFDFSYETLEGQTGRKTYQPHMDVDDFISQFASHFVNSIEGNCEVKYDDGYFDDYYVDGKPIVGMIQRAQNLNKKIRIEIL